MKHFDDYLFEARRDTDRMVMDSTKRRIERHLTREERRKRSATRLANITVILLSILLLLSVIVPLTTPAAGAETETTASAPDVTVTAITEEEVLEDYENEKIEEALFASGYFRDDVPLDGDTQALLRAACEESGIDYELALAVIEQETGYRNVTGDGGESVGYMQIQEKWHLERMARLGVTDLTDPYSNFRVGCDYLADMIGKYGLEEGLTAYNSGRPGESLYASQVLSRMHDLREADG